ncbi:hypothetical protein J1605_018586 [Eschrichtius robustus]|uniref:Uncharacterized protein n=1 Tax=Eschrichtius robustus TaxID=9764 RepID=A0AB34HUD1_ESCRO|nr:hypothetical protein J1605_018586 [Eschrichtius robustus]
MQGTWVRALVQEDPICCGATKPVSQLLSLRSRAHEPQLLKPACLEPVLRSKRSHRNEKPAHRNENFWSYFEKQCSETPLCTAPSPGSSKPPSKGALLDNALFNLPPKAAPPKLYPQGCQRSFP